MVGIEPWAKEMSRSATGPFPLLLPERDVDFKGVNTLDA